MNILKYMVFVKVISLVLISNVYAKKMTSLESVNVTAQKSEENVQKVPISISVFNDIDIEDKSILNLKDIAKYTPNLMLFHSGQSGLTLPSIRGVSGSILSFSSPVSLYVDGVPTMNSFGYDDAIEDIERIEVLKGPQGTLYGKNSEAGVINIITKKPNNTTNGKVFTSFGTNGKKEYGVNISGPIKKDKFYIGASYKHTQKDGFIKHSVNADKVNYKKNDYGKINLRYTPSSNVDISFIVSKSKSDNGAHDMALSGQKKNISISSNLEGSSSPSIDTYSLSLDYDIDKNTKLKSITTKRVHNDKAVIDNDLSPNSLRHFFREYNFSSLSQEMRFEKDISGTKLTTGVYLDKESNDLSLVVKTPFDPTGSNSKPQNLNSKSIGLFANIIHPLNDKLILNAGIRYDKEKKDIKIDDSSISIENEWKNISPKLSLQYDINKESMAYLTLTKGYRSGGFNPFAPSSKESYDEESLISYELGYKAMFLNNKIRLSTAIYYMNINDMQVQEMPTPSDLYMINAASATSKGLEFEVQALLSDELSLFTSIGLNKTTFDKFSDQYGDYSGNYNPYAPKYNYNLGLQYRNESGYYARFDLNGYGKTYFDKTNKNFRSAFSLVDTKIGYETNDYDIYLYTNNLFDKEYHSTNALFNGSTTIYSEGREVGFKLIYRF